RVELPRRTRTQSRLAAKWACLGRSLSCPRADDTARGAKRARVRPSQLSQAPSCATGRRPAQFGSVVPWLVARPARVSPAVAGCDAADLARRGRMAPSRRTDQHLRDAGRDDRPLTLTLSPLRGARGPEFAARAREQVFPRGEGTGISFSL